MPVRTARLAAGIAAAGGGEHIAYTCPPGRTAIVKDVRVASPAGANSRAVVFLLSGPARPAIYDQPLGLNQTAVVSGFIVLEPGDQLRLFPFDFELQYWISGAELEGLAP